MILSFSTKAGTLSSLQGVLKKARVAPLCTFTVEDWLADRQACLSDVFDCVGTAPWIVRSSCKREDTAHSSNAGAFLSIPNVNEEDLEKAVEQVIAEYGESQCTDEILIQPMLAQVVRSGVAFSHDPNICAPYRVVNWSECSDTAFVTSGLGGRVWQQAANCAFHSAWAFSQAFTLASASAFCADHSARRA